MQLRSELPLLFHCSQDKTTIFFGISMAVIEDFLDKQKHSCGKLSGTGTFDENNIGNSLFPDIL